MTRNCRGIGRGLLVALLLTAAASQAGQVWYVVSGGTGAGEGTAWDDAFASVGAAMTAVTNGDEVWVQAGTYTEQVTLKSEVALYGGFAGNETDRESRDWTGNVTTIDGTGQYHAVVGGGLSNVRIDGFTISGGNANGGYSNDNGGGIYAAEITDITVEHCTLRNNRCNVSGGAVFFYDCQFLLADDIFEENDASILGAAAWAAADNSAGPQMEIVRRCIVRDNRNPACTTCMGLYAANSTVSYPTLLVEDSIFVGNDVGGWGGAIFLYVSGPEQKALCQRCLFTDNSCQMGAGIGVNANNPGQVTIRANRFVGNRSVGLNVWGGHGQTVDIYDNVFIGNRDDSGPAALSMDGIFAHNQVYHNTFFSNVGSGLSGSVGLFQTRWPGAEPVLANNIFADNPQGGVLSNSTALPVLINNLFYQNAGWDYDNGDEGLVYTGGADIDRYVPGAAGNIAGDPSFLPSLTGTADSISYDDTLVQSTLLDSGASWPSNGLVGQWLRPGGMDRCFEILANSDMMIQVWGDLSDATPGSYEIFQVDQQDHGYGIDHADLSYLPDTDLVGRSRPGGDGLADIGCMESPDAYTGPVDVTPPVSWVQPLPPVEPPTFDLPWQAVDNEAAVSYVELYFRKDGDETWTKYGDQYPSSPISFTAPEGDGRYYFFTLATDSNSNPEAAKTDADATCFVAQGFASPVVYVDPDAGGEENGADWADALHQISPALSLAQTYAVPEVWVAEGTYHEALMVPNGVSLYGGFAGTESSRERDWRHHVTTINASSVAASGINLSNVADVTVEGFSVEGANVRLWVGESAIRVSDCTNVLLQYCHAYGNYCYRGSGVAITNSGVRMNGCTVDGNAGDLQGAGMYVSNSGQPFTMESCEIFGNFGWSSGMYLAVGNTEGIPALIQDCTFENNATSTGGALRVDQSGNAPVRLRHNLFVNNYGSNGGAIYCQSDGDPGAQLELSFNDFLGNWSSSGGALQLESFGGQSTWDHNLFAGNQASDGGGALTFDNVVGEVTLEFTTFARNQGPGGGTSPGMVWNNGSQVTLHNSVMVDNLGSALTLQNSAVMNLRYNLFDGNDPNDCYNMDTDTSLTGAEELNALPGAVGNLDGDPLFVPAPAGGTITEMDYERFLSEVRDDNAGWAPNELVGLYAAPNTANGNHLYKIVANSDRTFTLAGDVSWWHTNAGPGSNYAFYNFHEQAMLDGYPANSPLVDSGDPASPYDQEPAGYNGGRANMGRYGDTSEAGASNEPTPTVTPTVTPTATPTTTPAATDTATPTTTPAVTDTAAPTQNSLGVSNQAWRLLP